MKNWKKKLAGLMAVVTLMTAGTAAFTTASAEREIKAPTISDTVPAEKSDLEAGLEKVVESFNAINPSANMIKAVNEGIDGWGLGEDETNLIKGVSDALIKDNYGPMVNLPYTLPATKIANTLLEGEKAHNSTGWESVVHYAKVVEGAFDTVANFIPGGNLIVQVKDVAKEVGSYLIDKAESAVSTVVNFASDAWDGICDFFGNLF